MATRSGADEPLNLGQVLSRLDAVADDLTVYVRSNRAITPEVPIELVNEEEQDPAEGMSYLLEIGIMKDVIRVWKEWRGGVNPDISQACGAVAYYASHDAFQPI